MPLLIYAFLNNNTVLVVAQKQEILALQPSYVYIPLFLSVIMPPPPSMRTQGRHTELRPYCRSGVSTACSVLFQRHSLSELWPAQYQVYFPRDESILILYIAV